jgi:hypothetical protein
MYTGGEMEKFAHGGTIFLNRNRLLGSLMEDWKQKILRSDAGRAKPDLAKELIEKNGAEVLELSPLVGSPSQVSRSPAATVREEVLKLAPIIKELVRKDIREAEDE